jgi:hypothetical protein
MRYFYQIDKCGFPIGCIVCALEIPGEYWVEIFRTDFTRVFDNSFNDTFN